MTDYNKQIQTATKFRDELYSSLKGYQEAYLECLLQGNNRYEALKTLNELRELYCFWANMANKYQFELEMLYDNTDMDH